MSLSPPLPRWVFWSSLVPEALEIPVAITRPSQAFCLKGCRARSCLGLGWPGNTTCFSCSLKALFPTGGPIRGCMKGLKALGKYVDLKRMSTVGVSYGCTSDLLVSTSPGSLASMVGKGSTGPAGQAQSPLVHTETSLNPPGPQCRGVVARCSTRLAVALARPSEDLSISVTLPAPLQCQGWALASPPLCPSQVARSVSVHGHGYLTLALKDVPGLRDFYSGFSFRTSQREGLLYHHTTQVGTCSPPWVSQQQDRNICSCSEDGAWEKGGFWWGQRVNPQ